MHYIPKILNERNAFLRLNTLMRDSERNEKLVVKIEHFLYRATCVLVGLSRMYVAEGMSVNLVRSYLKQIKFGADRKIAISAEPLFEVYSQIPAALSQLVNMQNQILPILQAVFEINGSVPSSLNDAIKAGLKKYGFSDAIDRQINEYWSRGGKYIRDLRDINEHFVALVNYTYFKHEKDPGQILVLLPDNPEEKSPSKFTYNEELDAFDMISTGFNQLNELFEQILKDSGLAPLRFENSIYLTHMGSLEEEQERSLGIMIDITKTETTESGTKLYLDAIELMQIIPKDSKSGNLAVRKVKPDHEVFTEQCT